jgi:hypothetical protein
VIKISGAQIPSILGDRYSILNAPDFKVWENMVEGDDIPTKRFWESRFRNFQTLGAINILE